MLDPIVLSSAYGRDALHPPVVRSYWHFSEIQDGGRRHLGFSDYVNFAIRVCRQCGICVLYQTELKYMHWLLRSTHRISEKNINNSGLDKDMHQILGKDASRPCGDVNMTKSRNRKLIRVTSSNTCREQKGVDWYRAQAPHYEYHELCRIHLTWNSKMAATAILNFRKKCQ